MSWFSVSPRFLCDLLLSCVLLGLPGGRAGVYRERLPPPACPDAPLMHTWCTDARAAVAAAVAEIRRFRVTHFAFDMLAGGTCTRASAGEHALSCGTIRARALHRNSSSRLCVRVCVHAFTGVGRSAGDCLGRGARLLRNLCAAQMLSAAGRDFYAPLDGMPGGMHVADARDGGVARFWHITHLARMLNVRFHVTTCDGGRWFDQLFNGDDGAVAAPAEHTAGLQEMSIPFAFFFGIYRATVPWSFTF